MKEASSPSGSGAAEPSSGAEAATHGGADGLLAPIRSQVVKYYSLLAGAAVLGLMVTGPFRGEPPVIMGSYAALLVLFAVVLRLRASHPMLAGALCSLGPLVLVTIMTHARGGLQNPAAIMAYVTLVLVTGFTWNASGTGVMALLCSAVLGWLVADAPGPLAFNRWQVWAELVLQLVIVWGLVRFTLTALARSQADARASRERLQDVILNSPDATVGVDERGLILLFNRKAEELSGRAEDDALGYHLAELRWIDDAQIKRLDFGLRAERGSGSRAPLEVADRYGNLFEVTFSRLKQGADAMQLLSFRDVTERRDAQRAQEQIEARLANSRSIDALGRLAGGVAHDFNNLLTVVSSTAEFMRTDSSLSAAALEDVDRIDDAARRATRLTGQLLAFGRKQVLEPRVLALNDTVEELRPLLRRVIPENISFRVELEEGLGSIRADEARLEQVVINLISNASDAMSEGGGELVLRTRNVEASDVLASDSPQVPAGPCVEILVQDNGRGMDAETRTHLFEPFFTTKSLGQGTGLGLATVHGIVAQSGGHIAVESELGHGSRFYVYLPRTDEQAVEAVAPSSAHNERPVAGQRVLLVEDQEAVRKATERMLVRLGYEVETALDGQDAIDRYIDQLGTFDLLVSDVVMPRVNGPTLAARFRSRHPQLKVLFLSGYPEQALTQEGELSSNDAYLPKPFTLRGLSKKLEEALSA